MGGGALGAPAVEFEDAGPAARGRGCDHARRFLERVAARVVVVDADEDVARLNAEVRGGAVYGSDDRPLIAVGHHLGLEREPEGSGSERRDELGDDRPVPPGDIDGGRGMMLETYWRR